MAGDDDESEKNLTSRRGRACLPLGERTTRPSIIPNRSEDHAERQSRITSITISNSTTICPATPTTSKPGWQKPGSNKSIRRGEAGLQL